MKKTIKLFSFILISIVLLSFSNCSNTKESTTLTFEKNPPFSITEIYSQNWIAGVQEGGSGTNVFVTFSSMNESVLIEQFYFRNKVNDVKDISNEYLAFAAYFKGDTSHQIIMDSNPVKESKNTPPVAFPFKLKSNEVVISYLEKGSKKYFKVSEVEEKPTIAYPGLNPKGID